MTAEWGGLGTLEASGLIVAAFLLGRAPTSLALGRGLHLPKRDARAIFASMARGMTDVVLILFAAQSGLLPPAEVQFLLGIIPTTVLFAAIVCAVLVIRAARSPGAETARSIQPKEEGAAGANGP